MIYTFILEQACTTAELIVSRIDNGKVKHCTPPNINAGSFSEKSSKWSISLSTPDNNLLKS